MMPAPWTRPGIIKPRSNQIDREKKRSATLKSAPLGLLPRR